MKIQIKHINGSVLFEYDAPKNSVKDTLVKAVNIGAYLSGANLRGANLRGADLRGANLRGAYLMYADLGGADLTGADLGGAYLTGADLGGAYLTGAYLGGAYLTDAYLTDAKNADLAIAKTRILPEGDLIGYKKCLSRAEYATILELSEGTEAESLWEKGFKYRVGETVRPTNPFNENWQEECASGIHFYITRLEAENN